MRPFTRLLQMQERADQSLQGQQQQLQDQLKTMEVRLAQLQADKSGSGATTLDAGQRAELLKFQQQRQQVRSQLRDVQHQLNASIDALETRLKLLDILGVPLLLSVFAGIFAWWRRRKTA